MKCDKDLVPVKAAFFMFNAVLACFVPYKALYQMQLGITPSQNGIVQAIEKLMTLLAPPLIGIVADKLSRHKILMIVCVLLAVMFAFPMYFIPPVGKASNVECCITDKMITECKNLNITDCAQASEKENVTFWGCETSVDSSYTVSCNLSLIQPIFQEESNKTIQYQCDNASVNPIICKVFNEEIIRTNSNLTFLLLIVFTVLFSFFIFPVAPLIDAAAFNMLGSSRIADYGKQRLWGSIGFGVIGLLIGFLVDLYSSQQGQVDPDYLVLFIGMIVFGVFTAGICYQLKVPKYKVESVLVGLKILAKNMNIAVFLFVVLVSGFIIGVRFTFGFWYASTLPDASRTVFGLSILTSCAAEIPMFFVSGWIAQKIGCPACLSIGLLAASVRCYLYTVITSAWYLLLLDPLHGFSFALPMSAMCTYATILAPKGMNSTLIGLTQGVYWGLGNMLGALIGGFLYNQFGAIKMFQITAGIGCVSVVLYVGALKLLQYCCNSTPSEETDENELKTAQENEEENKLLKKENTLV